MRVSIKLKLGLAFGGVIALAVAAVTLGISNLATLNNSLDNLVSGPAQRQAIAQRLSSELLLLVRAEKNLMLAPDDAAIAKFEAEIVSQRQKVDVQRNRLDAIADVDTKSKLGAFNTAYQQFITIEDKVVGLAGHNSNAEAADPYGE